MCHLPLRANIGIVISDFQQKYAVIKAMGRSGGISKGLLLKNGNEDCTFRINL